MALPNPVALAGLAMALIGLQLQVRLVEEPYLQATHDAEYEQYASRVGRFPALGRTHPLVSAARSGSPGTPPAACRVPGEPARESYPVFAVASPSC